VADGGRRDPPRPARRREPRAYTAASAAYAVLRTGWGRSEAYADLTATRPLPAAQRAGTGTPRPGEKAVRAALLVPARVRHGRPWHLAARVLAALVLPVVAARSGAGGPATAGMTAGLVVWAGLTARGDLAPPPGR
jgi:hypothetical protein